MNNNSILTTDPREEVGFIAEYFPLANGHAAPAANLVDKNDRIIVEFLAVYYRLNCTHARLVDVRNREGTGSHAERPLLQEIETALRVRDGLEDKYAPYGIIAEPVFKDGQTVNVVFSFGAVQSQAKPRSSGLFSSVMVSIPLPEGVNGNGKMHVSPKSNGAP
jgi:hypothetical protein